jgi:dTDP-4-dehydrorhamnose reductase
VADTASGQNNVLVLGAKGMLGAACLHVFGPEVVGCDLDDFDLSDRAQTIDAITRIAPRLIVNCAAATDVDRCEIDHDYADRGNTLAAGNAAEAAARAGARLVHISTCFVFPGDKGDSYHETDPTGPVNYYGRSKLAGEHAVSAALPTACIVRTSWLYGLGGAHFPGKVLKWAAGGRPLRIVNDRIGSPTFAGDLAVCLKQLADLDATGIFHLGGTGCASRFEWARETLALAGIEVPVLPAASKDFPLPAERPADTCLDCGKAAGLGVRLPPWQEGLAHFLSSLDAAS